MKKLLSTLFVVLFATSILAQTGESCYSAIPVTGDYNATIDGPCTMWYTATTYDLPIKVHFSPVVDNSLYVPEVEIDLTCVPGSYDDPKIDSLIKLVEDFNISFPVELLCEKVSGPNGRTEYDLMVPKTYRDNLAEFGVTYPVQAYVKVRFYEAGSIGLQPDEEFSACMNGSRYVKLGDTIEINDNDEVSTFVFPYTDWKEDSIRFVWQGDGEAQIYVAFQECSFATNSSYVFNQFKITQDAPHKMYSDQMKSDIDEHGEGGLYYAKVLTPSSGKLIVEKIPIPVFNETILPLEYGKTISVTEISDQLYYFPSTWTATEFMTNMPDSVSMFLSAEKDFKANSDDPNVFTTYIFDVHAGKRFLQLSSLEMSGITSKVTDSVYVRFVAKKPTQLTVNQWNASDCAKNSRLIRPNKRFTVNKSNIYRLRYNDFVGYDMKISWTGTKKLTVSIAEDCELSNVIYSVDIAARKSVTIAVADLETWASRVDNEGFVYLKFTSSGTGNLTFSTDKPEDITPIIPSSPCVASSIELKSGDQLTLNLDSAFTIYRIEYAAWKDKGITLSWTGTTDLHTFVAETCTFAVAPYNRYVHVYVPVQGEHTLDANAMADLAEYVDEDGYLYIRFLTEKEGVLTVK